MPHLVNCIGLTKATKREKRSVTEREKDSEKKKIEKEESEAASSNCALVSCLIRTNCQGNLSTNGCRIDLYISIVFHYRLFFFY